MQAALCSKTLNRCDHTAVLHEGQLQAGVHALAVDQHRTGATLAVVAALLGAGEIEMKAQKIEQRHPGCHFERPGLAIDRERPRYCLRQGRRRYFGISTHGSRLQERDNYIQTTCKPTS